MSSNLSDDSNSDLDEPCEPRPVDMLFREKSGQSSAKEASSLNIVSWNVDAMSIHERSRLHSVLKYLRTELNLCSGTDNCPKPVCVMFQEVNNATFEVVIQDDWIKQHFYVVPSTPDAWPGGHYGNVTLVSRTLDVAETFSLDFPGSSMGRNALVVDVMLSNPASTNSDSKRKLRLASVHLESLGSGAEKRMEQLKLCAELMKADDISLGVVAGDMNAIRESDRKLPESFGFTDSWTGSDEDEAGFTWGYQPKSSYPPGRLDKICYITKEGVKLEVDSPERLGVGLKTQHDCWLSDHYGLKTTLRLLP